MKKHIVVADSGGSGTSFCFMDSNETLQTIDTLSLHPRYVFNWTAKQINEFEVLTESFRNKTLFFYGAGCAQQEISDRMKEWLIARGFSDVTVFPDTLGACRSAAGNNPGIVAILGTGSVLLEYDGTSISRQIGGFGPLIGDEGSGFYFAKLLIHNLLNTESQIPAEFQSIFTSKANIKKNLVASDAIQWMSSLAKETQSVPCNEIHQANFRHFTTAYLNQVHTDSKSKTLHVIGSYGCFQHNNLEKVLHEFNWELGSLIKSPVITLFHYHVNQLFSKS